MGTEVVLLLALGALLLLLLMIFCIYRFREQCERCFKRFLVVDIAMIFMFGVGALMWLFVLEVGAWIDVISFALVIWNLGVMGVCTLYLPTPERLHQFYLILLNTVMSIMMVVTLGRYLILVFVGIAALADFASEVSSRFRLLSPFLIPANVELIYTTPKILYTVGGLRLRAADLMWYGLLMGLIDGPLLPGACMLFTVVTALNAMFLFVTPFTGIRFRPLPICFAAAILFAFIQKPVFTNYIHAWMFYNNHPTAFELES